MKKTEAHANTVLNQYLREKRKQGFYCYYELKIAKGSTFNFNAIETNQDESLPALENEGLLWKLSDEDSRRKPCDGFSAPPLKAYLVIKFGRSFFFVRYSMIQQLKRNGKMSISLTKTKEIAELVFHT